MKKEITINDFSQHLFWDVDLNGFDFEKHKMHLIQKVLEYGFIEDWRLLKDSVQFVEAFLPDSIKQKCISITKNLGLRFGAIDLAYHKNKFYFILT